MEQLGCGFTRKVYKLNNDTIIKIPYNEKGFIQTQQEYQLYQINEYKPYLAEIYSYDENTGYLTMELLENCGYILKEDAIKANMFPNYILDLIDSQILQVGKDKNSNIKIFDYGTEHVSLEEAKTYPIDIKNEIKRFSLRKFKN